MFSALHRAERAAETSESDLRELKERLVLMGDFMFSYLFDNDYKGARGPPGIRGARGPPGEEPADRR